MVNKSGFSPINNENKPPSELEIGTLSENELDHAIAQRNQRDLKTSIIANKALNEQNDFRTDNRLLDKNTAFLDRFLEKNFEVLSLLPPQRQREILLKNDPALGEFFTKTWTPILPPISTKLEIRTAIENDSNPNKGLFDTDQSQIVTVWRGCNGEQLKKMVEKKSAGGDKVNVEAPRLTEKEIIMQVGELASFPEFTSNMDIAEGFGTDSYVCAFKIDAHYLSKGSGTEEGWVCNTAAPVELVGWKSGRDSGLGAVNKAEILAKKKAIMDRANEELAKMKTKTLQEAKPNNKNINQVSSQ